MSTRVKQIIRNSRIAEFNPSSEDWKERGVEIFKLTPYQYRLVKGGHEIDYYPTSGRYHDVTYNNWGTVPAYDLYKLF